MASKDYLVVQKAPIGFLSKMRAPVFRKLDIELTERCNNQCVHCCINLPEDDGRAKADEMTTAEIKRILTEAAALGYIEIRLTGGEPLLREDFEELYVFARKLGMKALIFTNATLITERLAELWSKIPPLTPIEVSVYGMTRASCEKVTRTRGSFEAAQRGIGLLRRYNIPFVVKSIYGFWDEKEIKMFEDFATTIPWMNFSLSYTMFFHLNGRRDESRNARIRQVRVSPEEGLRQMTRDGSAYRKEMKLFCSTYMGPQGDKLFSCGAGCGGCVDAYGKLQPCLSLRHPSCVVDLKREPLKAALEEVFTRWRGWKATNPDYLKRCAKCFLKGLCEQCPANSWAEHGALDRPVEYLCQVAHAQARFLELVQADENAWEVEDWRVRVERFVNS